MSVQVIPISPRTEGMVDAAPDYYQNSAVWAAIQNAKALEYDRVNANNEDLVLQFSPYTATWGLVFWEGSVGLPQNPAGSYEQRRPLVLSRLIGEQNFNAGMLHDLAGRYNEEIRVEIDADELLITVVFQTGVPPFLTEFQKAVDDIIHAGTEAAYRFEYHINGELRIAVDYAKYVYVLPVAGAATLCGTLPSIAVECRTYAANANITPTGSGSLNPYRVCGQFYSGGVPKT